MAGPRDHRRLPLGAGRGHGRHHVLPLPAAPPRLFAWPGNYLASNPDITGVPQSVLEFVKPEWALGVAFILFGFGALTYAKHPEGIIEAQTTASIQDASCCASTSGGAATLAEQEAAIDLELAGGGAARPTDAEAAGGARPGPSR